MAVIQPAHLRVGAKWFALVAASIASGALAQFLRTPAAWLIAPMIVAIAMAVGGIGLRLPKAGFTIAQCFIAITVAQVLTGPVVADIAAQWLPIVGVVVSTVIAAGVAGWLLARFSPLSAATAAWGSSPGAAAAMTAMSGDFGADVRVVAFMQYLRVTLVVLSSSLVSRTLFFHPTAHAVQASAGSTPFDLTPFLETLVFALVTGFAGAYSKLPGAQFLFPMLGGALLHALGLLPINMPWWAIDFAYVMVGWNIGLLYTRETVRFVVSVFPILVMSTVVLLALCGVSAVLLVAWLHVDPLTAYLATTPGGLDSVAIIALGSGSNVALVVAIQIVRLFVVIGSGPSLAKLIARLA